MSKLLPYQLLLTYPELFGLLFLAAICRSCPRGCCPCRTWSYLQKGLRRTISVRQPEDSSRLRLSFTHSCSIWVLQVPWGSPRRLWRIRPWLRRILLVFLRSEPFGYDFSFIKVSTVYYHMLLLLMYYLLYKKKNAYPV